MKSFTFPDKIDRIENWWIISFSQLKLDPSIYESLQKEHVQVGDVIYIEANSGAAKRIGRSDAYATEFDLEAEEYVPLPKVSFFLN